MIDNTEKEIRESSSSGTLFKNQVHLEVSFFARSIIFGVTVFIYSIMKVKKEYLGSSIDVLFYFMFYIINTMKKD